MLPTSQKESPFHSAGVHILIVNGWNTSLRPATARGREPTRDGLITDSQRGLAGGRWKRVELAKARRHRSAAGPQTGQTRTTAGDRDGHMAELAAGGDGAGPTSWVGYGENNGVG